MEHIKEVLKNLSDNDMHVHELVMGESIPAVVTVIDTHYIMQGADIVHVGNLTTIESFALRLTQQPPF